MATATLTRIRTRTHPISRRRETEVFRLPTQEKRAAFVRKEMDRLGYTIEDLGAAASIHWSTAARYARLNGYESKDPRTETTRKVFLALGYSLAFVAKEARGIVEL